MMKKTLGLCAILTLAACSTPAPVQQKSSDFQAASQARVRLFGQNQKPTIMVSGIDCAAGEKGTKVNTGGSLGDAFGSLVGTVNSHSIGIAETAHTRYLGQENGILSRAFFREYVVPAGKAVNVQTFFVGLTNVNESPTMKITQYEGSCRSNKVSFVPQAGRDYEVVGVSGQACGVKVYEVSKSGDLTPVTVNPAVSCARK
ncbi:hypothetical protein [Wielerella bovis]|uniref:hypothetical protein n=1 Tax=Wielerella bovis TaxID=2917790 RepID=UPI0020195A2B|nr:hypothetical protein [Wielerella bovis]ULJ60030.1 hypothetical protein MIS44_10270 [Wielerella bovis]